jgi:hypothetical protein
LRQRRFLGAAHGVKQGVERLERVVFDLRELSVAPPRLGPTKQVGVFQGELLGIYVELLQIGLLRRRFRKQPS